MRREEEEPTLRSLMADYQAGSVEAFDRLHDALAPDLKAYLTSLTRDSTRADDLLQETVLQVHRARAAHTPGEPVRPWMFAIAKRVFLMDVRGAARRARREQHEESSATASTPADRLHTRRRVESALRQAPPDGRRAFLLHHLFGYSFKEVAAKLVTANDDWRAMTVSALRSPRAARTTCARRELPRDARRPRLPVRPSAA